jgi:NADPH-dependent 2,4-dienoyl-CoA reductase/sulfur reductase-like enzyme
LPTMSDVERKKLLNFCIVGAIRFFQNMMSVGLFHNCPSGAGPTGVEFAAELHDLLHTDMDRYYPTLSRLAKITLYDTADHILGSFDKSLVKCASTVILLLHSDVKPKCLAATQKENFEETVLVYSRDTMLNVLKRCVNFYLR